jgi:hypothetical protein
MRAYGDIGEPGVTYLVPDDRFRYTNIHNLRRLSEDELDGWAENYETAFGDADGIVLKALERRMMRMCATVRRERYLASMGMDYELIESLMGGGDL